MCFHYAARKCRLIRVQSCFPDNAKKKKKAKKIPLFSTGKKPGEHQRPESVE